MMFHRSGRASVSPMFVAFVSIGIAASCSVGPMSDAGDAATTTVSAPSSLPPPSTASSTSLSVASGRLELLDPSLRCTAATRTLDVEGHDVRLKVPRASERVAVVIALHGYKETPERLAGFSQLDLLADAGRAVVLYPSGTPLDLGYGWNSGARRFATRDGDDAGLVSSVLDAALALGCADPARVYLAGESNGGGMALRAACDPRLAGRLAGVVLVNPAIDEGVLDTCTGPVPSLRLLATVGQRDRIIPVDGSRAPFVGLDEWFPVVSSRLSACSAVGDAVPWFSDRVTLVRGRGCASCAELFTSSDGGHTWPGADEALNGAPIGSFGLTDVLSMLVVSGQARCPAG